MVEKIVLVFVGILVKSFYDWVVEHGREVEKLRDETAKYKPNPAVLKGSQEALSIIAEHRYRTMMEPTVKRLHQRAMLWKWSAPLVYVALIILLLWWSM